MKILELGLQKVAQNEGVHLVKFLDLKSSPKRRG